MVSRPSYLLGLAVIAALATAPAPARAAVVTISLDGVTFSGGGTASGSFNFDTAGGGSGSSFNFSTTASAPFPGTSFGAGATAFWANLNLHSANNTYTDIIYAVSGTDVIALLYVAPTTDYAGYVAANPDSYITEATSGQGDFGPSFESAALHGGGNDIRNFASAGQAVQAAPEPASLALIGAGLFGLGAARRRRAAWSGGRS